MRTLDPTLHNAARIRIVSRLALSDLRFAALRDATELTPGNLSTHLESLERAGYVRQRHAFFARRPGRIVALTPEGRAAFAAYVEALDALLADLRPLAAGSDVAIRSSSQK